MALGCMALVCGAHQPVLVGWVYVRYVNSRAHGCK